MVFTIVRPKLRTVPCSYTGISSGKMKYKGWWELGDDDGTMVDLVSIRLLAIFDVSGNRGNQISIHGIDNETAEV